MGNDQSERLVIKRFIGPDPQQAPADRKQWLNLGSSVQVELTSEDAEFPVESGLLPGSPLGWRAAQPGPQSVRLVFDRPQKIRRLYLQFHETELARTQQFLLQWSSDGGRSYREIVRQQYNFSPPETTEESEDYTVDLEGVTHLELNIVPDISGGPARASFAQFRIA